MHRWRRSVPGASSGTDRTNRSRMGQLMEGTGRSGLKAGQTRQRAGEARPAGSIAETWPALELRGIRKSFDGVEALSGASLACERGEVRGLVGENGAGKSTFLKVLAGAIPADA